MSEEAGVPLRHYIEHHPDVGVLVACQACQRWERFEMAAIVERLKVHGIEPMTFPITQVANLIRKRCKSCGAVKWDSRPCWSTEKPPALVKVSDSPMERTNYNAARKGFYDWKA